MNNNALRNSGRKPQSLWYSLRWYFLWLNGIRWQIHIAHGLCRFRNQYAPCCLIPCCFRHCVGLCLCWFPPWIARIPPEHHKILKTHKILIIFLYFMGNYVTCKNYTQKEKKSLHTFDEEPLFINCKNPCRFRNTVSILKKTRLNLFSCANFEKLHVKLNFLLKTSKC